MKEKLITPSFLCWPILSTYRYPHTKSTHAFYKSSPTEDQAGGQSAACLPVLRRDVMSPPTDGEITVTAPKMRYFVMLPATDHSLITPSETD